MRYHEYSPHPVLRDTVKCFWVHEGTYSAEDVQDITPDGCVELIFNFGSPYRLCTSSPSRVLPAAILVGFQKKTLPVRVNGTVRVVAARFFAWGALALLEEEASAHRASGRNGDRTLDAGVLSPFLPDARTGAVTALNPGWDALVERLRSQVSQGQYEDARTTLQAFLIPRALARAYDCRLVQAAAKLLYHTKGRCRIEELADYCHTSVRQLQRSFRDAVGASPKFFARTLRFGQAQRRLMFAPEADLTQLAYQCGYFDQAHFIKEFKAFAGKTPSEYARQMRELRERLRGQDVVFLQSEFALHG